MIELAVIFGFLILFIIAVGSCRVEEPFVSGAPVLELRVHKECEARCKSFIDNVWAPAAVWMRGPDGLGFDLRVVDESGAPAQRGAAAASKMDLATRDPTRDALSPNGATYPVARVVGPGVSLVYTGSHDWPAFRRWLSEIKSPS
jgi:hypothetical protein